MFCMGSKGKKISISHPLGDRNDIDRLDVEKTEELKNLLIQGFDVSDQLIRGHMRLAIAIVARYAVYRKGSIDDLVSEAIYAMVLCCKRVANREVDYPNITTFFAGRIHSRCSHFITEDRLLGVSGPTRKKLIRQGLVVKTVVPIEDDTCPTCSGEDEVDLIDLLESCAKNNRQKRIMRLRMQGFKLKEISAILEIHFETVSAEYRKVKRTFFKLLKESK